MRMKRLILGTAAIGLLLAAGSTPTAAGPLDQRIVAIGIQYVPTEVTLTEGELLEFTHLDVAPHDVVSLDNGSDGKPLFSTDVISAGTTVPIEGIEKLRPGAYDFTCTLHPQMVGTVFVEGASG